MFTCIIMTDVVYYSCAKEMSNKLALMKDVNLALFDIDSTLSLH